MSDSIEFGSIKTVLVDREDTDRADRVVVTAERLDGTRIWITFRRQGGPIVLEVIKDE